MNKRLLFAAAAISLAATGPAVAQQTPIQLILNFDGPQLGQALTELGATWQKRANDQGAPYYDIRFGNGANAVAIPTACANQQAHTGCSGLQLWANFTKPPQLSPGAVAQRVNQYNRGHLATVAIYNDAGNAELNMYLIADNGIAINNVRVRLQVFENSTGSFSQLLYNQ